MYCFWRPEVALKHGHRGRIQQQQLPAWRCLLSPYPFLPAELHDLLDPEGVAQTTVSLLSEKAPERRLPEFLDHKVAGIRAVVDALQVGLQAERQPDGLATKLSCSNLLLSSSMQCRGACGAQGGGIP